MSRHESGQVESTLLTADRLIDGTSHAPLRTPGAVLLRGDRIHSVGSPEDYGSLDVNRIAYGDASILPGLIDTHVHLTMPGDGTRYEEMMARGDQARHSVASQNARAHLLGGVTTIRDTGSHLDLLEWRGGLDSQELPRLLLYGPPLTEPHGHMHLFGGECRGPEAVRHIAQRNLDAGTDGLKLVASGGGTLGTDPRSPAFSVAEVRAAVEVARRHGRVITAHALAAVAVERAAAADVDGIEHVGYLNAAGEEVFEPSIAAQVIARGIHVGSTLSVNHRFLSLASVADAEREAERRSLQAYLDNASAFHRMGGVLVAGSDAGWQITPFGDFAAEVEFLTRAGLGNLEAIESATARSASYLGLLDVGRIRPGYVADLLVVSGDPTREISDLRRVRSVWRAGNCVHTAAGAEPNEQDEEI